MPVTLLNYVPPMTLYQQLILFHGSNGDFFGLSDSRKDAVWRAYRKWMASPSAAKMALQVMRGIGVTEAEILGSLDPQVRDFARRHYATDLFMRDKQAPGLPRLPPNVVRRVFANRPLNGNRDKNADKFARLVVKRRGRM